MSPIELLSRLRDLHVQVIADGERLRVRAPEGALTPELQAELAAHKAAILALLKGSSAVAVAPAPRAAAAGDALPLSFAQERFWFLEHLEQGTSAHHLVFAIRFEGALDERAVRGALQHLVDRHAALRTSFVDDGGRPRQVIAVHAAADVRLVDLQQHPAAERFTEAVRVAQAASREPFDLGRAPLMRNLLLRISPLDHVLAFVFHHIVSDGWSTGIVMRDFAEAYRAARSGTAATLPPLPVGYADFALRQREALASGVLAAQTDYWKKQLTGLSTLELPTDRPRPAVLTVRGAEYRFTLGKALSESLVRLSHREGVTLFMTALAGFQALLHRYSQQDEFAVGTAIAGRSAAEFDDVVGPFINTLVLRSNLEGNPSFRELLRRVRVTALDAYANQDLPFEKLVDELQPDRDLSRNALYQVIFALQNLPVPDVRLEGLTLSVVPLERVTAALDLDWLLYPTPEGLQGTIRYSSDLFDAATVERMARHYEHLLESAVAAPQQRIADLSMLDDRERTLVTSEWNQTARPYPDRAGLAELFEAQVRRRPAAVAIADDVQTLTYAELNERANRLAHFLIDCGIGPDALVGVFHERCVDAIVALVAIMKAGGAYLPLDPAYPEERLALMLDDARPGVLLTRRALAERLPRFHGRVVCLDELSDRLRGESAANPALRSSPEHLAYVTYTSGSTGVPKGVEVRQRGVTRLLFGVDYVQIAEDDGFLQLASISFDASTFEVWGALLHGARLALLEEAVPTPDQLGEVLARHRVTILWLTASFFNAIVDVNPDVLSGVRQLLIGGEALSVAHVRRAQAALPGTQIINGYGPTESTTFTCCYRIPALPDDGVTSISIGRPIGNTTVRVLDAAGRPCAVGVPGELYIGGDGLARGYLHHPALTAERFVPDPSGAPGARLYRTGDIVRYAPDGLIQFLGRNDEQVKIRGFRVEPGEVEQVLRQHPDVAEAAVIVQKQSPTSRRLVAYVAPKRGAGAPDFLDEVKQFAQGQLPAYMVPAAFVVIPALPLTANGKLDRRALPDPEPVRRGDTAGGAPRNAVEAALAEVWVRVLRVERVGIDEDFFALGGDSILSLQVVAGVRQHGLKVTPRQIFEHPTVSALARVAQVLEPARPDAAAARAAIATGEVPLTPIQHWFFEQAPARPEHFNHAVLLRLTQPIDRARLADALAHVIDRHDALRLRFARTADGGWRQWYAESNTAPMVSAFDLSAHPPAEQAAAIERHGAALQASFDLSSGPTVAMATFDLGAGGSRVLFVVHHLAIDAVSWGVLLGDLQTAYQQLTRHEAVNLGETTAAFGAWARLLRAHAERIAPETSFWAALADAPLPSWPLDEPGGENVAASERTIAASLSADDTHALLQEIPRKYGMRIHEILLVALAGTFAEWTKHPAVLVDVEGHGRETLEDEDVDLTRTVGWFTTIHPVLLDLTRTTTIDERLKRVKEQLRRVPNHGLGYGVLRHLAADPGVRQRLADVPTPDVSFNYLGQVDGTFARGLFAPAVEPAGPATDPRNPRAHVFEVSARVLGGQLHVAWHYSAALHSASTAERLTRRFLDLVREIVAHCRSTQAAAALTPSDFPEANVSQDELDRLLASIGEIESQS